jgi:hypothetical protein
MGLVQSNAAGSGGDIVRAEGFGFRVHADARGLLEICNRVVVCFGCGKASEKPEFLVLREDMFEDWADAASYSAGRPDIR